MSHFGKNIRKIRKVKGLSQHAFASLFDLKRATLGAYEEGRSEPKISTLIKVANHFSIDISDLLQKDLTVDALLNVQDKMSAVHDELTHNVKLIHIPLLTDRSVSQLRCEEPLEIELNDIPKISIPDTRRVIELAYQISGLEMSRADYGLFPGDVVLLGPPPDAEALQNLAKNQLCFVNSPIVTAVRFVTGTETGYQLAALHDHVPMIDLNAEELTQLRPVVQIITNSLPHPEFNLQETVSQLQEQIRSLVE